MRKRCLICILMVFIISTLALSACQKVNDNDIVNNTDNINIVNENVIIDMFTKNAQYDSYGEYRFREYKTLNNVSFLYSFVYSRSYQKYNCSILVTSYAGINLYDYASITFSWGNFKNGLYYAYHELDSIARIEFEYSNISFTNNGLGNKYSYKVTSNSFTNLQDKNDIDEYASESYDCLKQVVIYLKSIFAKYNVSTNLW